MLKRQSISLRLEAQQLSFQLFDARSFHFAALAGGAQFAVVMFPTLLPGSELRLHRSEGFGAGLLKPAQLL